MARFFNQEQRDYDPSNNGIDWRARDLARLAILGETEAQPVWFESGDGLSIQCTQENTTVYLNEVADEMDCIHVFDKRDEQVYVWFREQLGDQFDLMRTALVPHSQGLYSYYPRDEIVAVYIKRQLGDI
ncbi:MAG: hypothetical protein NVS1B10_01490 [Candidatus Saccharimonadales bacterium]